MEENRICCICGKEFFGWGNNAYPIVEDGLCCDDCNFSIVIPARLEELEEGDN